MENAQQEEKRLKLLLRHIQHVEDNCKTIAASLTESGEADFDFIKQLLHNSRIHDASKFNGIEWEHLDSRSDPLFQDAIKLHITTNPHHPEYWGRDGIHNMPEIYISEMVCDWQSRSSELRSNGLIYWIEEQATKRYNFNKTDKVYKSIYKYVDILLEPAFI